MEAALDHLEAAARVERWRLDQGRGESVGQRGMATEIGQQGIEQVRPVGLTFKVLPEDGAGPKSVAQLRQVAGAAAARHQPPERAADVRHGLERVDNPCSADWLFMQPLNQRQPGQSTRNPPTSGPPTVPAEITMPV